MTNSYLPESSHILFAKNKGQWNNNVLYQGKFKGGKVFLENQGFTYVFYPKQGLESIHHKINNPNGFDSAVTYHSVKMEFVNGNPKSTFQELDSNLFFENYFIGNNPAKWASNVKSFKRIIYENLYTGIKIKAFSDKNNFRYDFIVEPHADIEQIAMNFKGQNYLKIINGNLIINTLDGDVTQNAPLAYQIIDKKEVSIACSYILENDMVKLKLGSKYDKRFAVVIDPTLVFATYTGSLSDNFGMTATYDIQGNAYTAGVCFGPHYPLTTGAFQVNFMGGSGNASDISISKFNPSGTNLLYSTYLGGANNEAPQSIVVNNLGELIVFGRTRSTNFPVTSGAFQTSNAGNNDLIITKFNKTGTALIASTYMGGSQNDGVNGMFTALHYNYSDDMRGSVIVDDSNNIYIGTCTNSNNFPITTGCFQNSLKGSQDACVIKFDPNLSTPFFSTYFGGSLIDGIYNIALDKNKLYVTGGTESVNFPVTTGSLHTTLQGSVDGFVSLFSASGNSVIASTYIGTAAYDQSYFIQLDKENRVYIFGQTEGQYPVSSGVYSNPNSGQFIHCLNSTLSSTFFSTVIGSGDGFPDIVPSAFMVDVCENIYLSGWGGPSSKNCSTFGLPVTTNAYLNVTDGRDFYFMVLNKNALSLQYATFFGGKWSAEHVDGGTSRFDKTGIIYQAICESCGGNNDMPATPNAWSSQNGSSNCNNAVVKFSFNANLTIAQLSTNHSSVGCAPFSVNFINNSSNGVNYLWNFGDGNISTAFEPTHTYTASGVYSVQLISNNYATCNGFDTTYTTINVIPPLVLSSIPPINMCLGDSVSLNLNAPAASTYTWFPSAFLNNRNIQQPKACPPSNLIYKVTVEKNGCFAYDSVQLIVNKNDTKIVLDPNYACVDDTIKLMANQVCSSYQWSCGQNTPQINVFQQGWFSLSTIKNNCLIKDSIRVDSFTHVDVKTQMLSMCLNDKKQLFAPFGNYTYLWQPNHKIDNTTIYNPVISPDKNITYTLSVFNGPCKTTGNYDIKVYALPSLTVTPKKIEVFSGEFVQINSFSDTISIWEPTIFLSCTFCNSSIATTQSDITYYATVKNKYGCVNRDSVEIKVSPTIYIPNSFSPNDDLLNDIFKPEYTGFMEVELSIFDRWGQMIFTTNDLKSGWNGKYKESNCETGVYVYKLTAMDIFSKTLDKIGHVMLLR